jgi:hypothetical protein
MQIKFKIGGHDVAAGKLEESIEDAAFKQVKEQMSAKIAAVRCPEHAQPPQLEFDGASLKTIKVKIKACCETCRGLAVAAMNAK